MCDLTNCVIRAAHNIYVVPVYAICMSLCDFVYATSMDDFESICVYSKVCKTVCHCVTLCGLVCMHNWAQQVILGS